MFIVITECLFFKTYDLTFNNARIKDVNAEDRITFVGVLLQTLSVRED